MGELAPTKGISSELRWLIQRLASIDGQPAIPVKTFDATVVSVDAKKRTCVVNSEAHHLDGLTVRLMPETSDGDMNIPAVDSTVIVMMTSVTEPYIVSTSFIDKKILIIDTQGYVIDGSSQKFNDGKFGGLTKTIELRTQLNKMVELMQSILSVINTPVTEPGNGAPSAFQAALLSAVTKKTPGDYSNIENKSITHGEKL